MLTEFLIKRQRMSDVEAARMADLFMKNPDSIVGGLVEELLVFKRIAE